MGNNRVWGGKRQQCGWAGSKWARGGWGWARAPSRVYLEGCAPHPEPTGHLQNCLHADDDMRKFSCYCPRKKLQRIQLERSCSVQVTGKMVWQRITRENGNQKKNHQESETRNRCQRKGKRDEGRKSQVHQPLTLKTRRRCLRLFAVYSFDWYLFFHLVCFQITGKKKKTSFSAT